jgi:hypothetical protein
MRIGLMAPPLVPVPPPGYGGAEEVIDNLARGLTALAVTCGCYPSGSPAAPVRRRWLCRGAGRADGRSLPGGSACPGGLRSAG